MKIFIARTFQWWEIGLIKVCLISLGILLGLYFSQYLIAFTQLWWALFAVTGIYFIVRLFREE